MKGPRVLAIHREPDYGGRDLDDPLSFHITITIKQLRKLPMWVQSQLHWIYDTNVRHCVVVIQAKDELEAFIRFNKLWAGLPKE